MEAARSARAATSSSRTAPASRLRLDVEDGKHGHAKSDAGVLYLCCMRTPRVHLTGATSSRPTSSRARSSRTSCPRRTARRCPTCSNPHAPRHHGRGPPLALGRGWRDARTSKCERPEELSSRWGRGAGTAHPRRRKAMGEDTSWPQEGHPKWAVPPGAARVERCGGAPDFFFRLLAACSRRWRRRLKKFHILATQLHACSPEAPAVGSSSPAQRRPEPRWDAVSDRTSPPRRRRGSSSRNLMISRPPRPSSARGHRLVDVGLQDAPVLRDPRRGPRRPGARTPRAVIP